MLLRFRVANHRSLRDEQELSLVGVPGRGQPKPTGPVPPTVRVAGIYGANASGKSNVLHALGYLRDAVEHSHTRWPALGGTYRDRFLLDARSAEEPSGYEIDLLVEGVRYSYGFEIDDKAVLAEWLYSFPHGARRRMLFEREEADFKFGRSLPGRNAAIAGMTRPNALFLSAAASNQHEILLRVFRAVVGISPVFHEGLGTSPVPTADWLGTDEDLISTVNSWLRVADVGIDSVSVSEMILADDIKQQTQVLIEAFRKISDDDSLDDVPGESSEIRIPELQFRHHADSADISVLGFHQESSGTRIWLAVLPLLIKTLRHGLTLVLDEIDSSMHPALSGAIVTAFKDPEINRSGAQLVFSTHDVSLLSGLLDGGLLARDEVWFTEKDRAGATSLYPLSDFHPRQGENLERGYLQGRYGAVPFIDVQALRLVFAAKGE
ncbi:MULTISPECIES: AAA family ATPase [Actinoalloteichus]|uniref:AAA domain n=1 Tax=Actinoalloteichus fjordicus TaxID=1612552 RepID=A0AAC9LH22_9PSEU|nr:MULTISPECIES: ATP-binding protein [Actinoalloteichus]APU17551.1 AAA domain [Actinoalloteichus fjordicus]APU23629.1 AAA domain [Actinoalloteichus sp. GBA129-24]